MTPPVTPPSIPTARKARSNRQSILIRELHLDTFGHMNNAVYLQLFEQARWDIIEAGGYGITKIQETGLGPVIVEVSVRFMREIRLRESIDILSEPEDWSGGKIMRMKQSMINAAGEECCVANFVFGLFDLKRRKMVTPTAEWLEAVGYQS